MTEKTSLLYRDPDGAFALVRPLGERRGRVVFSSLFAQGDVVFLPRSISWEGAAVAKGAGTRLEPSELVVVGSEPEDLRREGPEGEESRLLYEMLEGAD